MLGQGFSVVVFQIAQLRKPLRLSLDLPGDCGAGHDLEAIQRKALDEVLVLLEKGRGGGDILGLLARVAGEHGHANTDAASIGIGEKPAGNAEINAFRHGVQHPLTTGLETGRQPDHAR